MVSAAVVYHHHDMYTHRHMFIYVLLCSKHVVLQIRDIGVGFRRPGCLPIIFIAAQQLLPRRCSCMDSDACHMCSFFRCRLALRLSERTRVLSTGSYRKMIGEHPQKK